MAEHTIRQKPASRIRSYYWLAGSIVLLSGIFAVLAPVSENGDYADSGNGQFKDYIFWFTWENGDLANGIHPNDSKTFSIPGGLNVTATFSNIGYRARKYVPTDMNTWSGSASHNYYQISTSNGEAFYGPDSYDAFFRLSLIAQLDGQSYIPDVIFLDAESTDSEESIEVATNGNNWEVLERLGSGQVSLEFDSPTEIELEDGSEGNPLLLSRAASQFDVEIEAGGRQGVSFGIWFALDFGDAPDSYHTSNANSGAKHIVDPSKALYLGGQVDVEADGVSNGNGNQDDGDNYSDEDGISFPASLDAKSGYTLDKDDITLTNQSGGTATLHAWIDFDQNGQFDSDEYASTTVSNNTVLGHPTSDLVWSGIDDGLSGTSYARFRLTSDPGINASSASGLALNGEVEDYQINIAFTELPVEWLSVEAIWQQEQPNIRWQTASELNTNFFQIERQRGRNGLFEQIGQIKAAGTSQSVQHYQFLDQSLADFKKNEVIIYRIKQVDIDGQFDYSQQVELISDHLPLRLNAYPSPASHTLNLVLQSSFEDPGLLKIYDLNGALLFECPVQGSKELELNVSHWVRGLYIIRLESELNQIHKRIVLQ